MAAGHLLRLSFPGFFNKPWTEIVTMTALRSFLFLTASAVAALAQAVPAITGTRPLASSTQSSITRLCSSWLRVGDSPVVPQGTRPWVPSAICQFTSLRNAASSTLPSLKGVITAVMEPLMRSRISVMTFSVPGCGHICARPVFQ